MVADAALTTSEGDLIAASARNRGTLGGSIVFADPNADAGPAYIRSCYA